MKRILLIFIFCTIYLVNGAVGQQMYNIQQVDLKNSCADSCKNSAVHKFKPSQLIAPVALISFGAIGSQIDDIKEFDFGISRIDEHKSFVVEDVTQYVPAASYYVLKLSGVESRHNYRDATVILAASYCIAGVTAKITKELVGMERPNGYDNKSFPSGHSTIAFAGAEFLRMEYKDVSPWIGVAGYAVATGTALGRIRHNEHWFTDLLAGAGVGILSTKVAYWVYPPIQRLLFKNCRKERAFIGIPYYNGESAGVSLALSF